jgi:hypothetical protein
MQNEQRSQLAVNEIKLVQNIFRLSSYLARYAPKGVYGSYLTVPCGGSIAAKRKVGGEVVQESFQAVTRCTVNLKCKGY